MSFVEMIPGRLYIGGRIRSSDWGFIQRHITAIINIRITPDRPPFDFSHRTMIWAPLTVLHPPELQWIIAMTKLMNSLMDPGHTILLHDTLGIHRLGFVITAFYMQRFGLSRDQALAAVRSRKSDIDPPDNYLKLLSQFEAYLESS
ncbi:dual specificity protein phosphatase family protein [Bacillus songklensis]|uniref:Dual specificity protein phosphatase family protein n=1 Tax=Bacillus songklensis TaxID=1069116 RepID=A0ABV8AYT7_9BACI